ncbi:MAG: hypothetical protein ACOX0D_03195 [Sphaerochaeta sp.]
MISDKETLHDRRANHSKPEKRTGRPHSEHLAILIAIGVFVASIVMGRATYPGLLSIGLTVVSALYAFIIGPIMYVGLKVLTKNEALVLTLFGKYYGTLKQDGFFFVNPFCSAFNPTAGTNPSTGATREKKKEQIVVSPQGMNVEFKLSKKKISLKAMTLNNDKQKINDSLGNPIIIGVVVIWRGGRHRKSGLQCRQLH